MIMNQTVKTSLLEWKPRSDRLVMARCNYNFGKHTVIAYYAPTEDAEDEIMDEFEESCRKKLGPHLGIMYSWW